MKVTLRLGFLVSLAVATSAASASAHGPKGKTSSGDSCLSAPVEGQKLQRAGKLLEARKSFAKCAVDTCPKVVRKSCKAWLAQVRADQPSVQFSARDQDGLDVSGVQVSIDGKPSIPLGPGAVDIDPGKHEFVFHHVGSPDITRRVVIDTGSKKVGVSVIFSSAATTPKPPPPKPDARVDLHIKPVQTEPKRPVPVLAWVLGGVGVAGLTSFATFGTLGLVQRGGAECAQDAGADVFKSCQDSAFTKFRIADISLGVAVVGLGAATWLYLERPTVYERSTALAVGIQPTAHGGLAAVKGTF